MTDAKKPTGDYASPTMPVYSGVTLRDWFAGQALMGFIAYSPSYPISKEAEEVAQRMYRMADAMIAERNK